MSTDNLQGQIRELRSQLEHTGTMSPEERKSLESLVSDIEQHLRGNQPEVPHDTLSDSLDLAVERFEISHPTIAMTLRNIMQSLISIGI